MLQSIFVRQMETRGVSKIWHFPCGKKQRMSLINAREFRRIDSNSGNFSSERFGLAKNERKKLHELSSFRSNSQIFLKKFVRNFFSCFSNNNIVLLLCKLGANTRCGEVFKTTWKRLSSMDNRHSGSTPFHPHVLIPLTYIFQIFLRDFSLYTSKKRLSNSTH
jgi:hypothetical protein